MKYSQQKLTSPFHLPKHPFLSGIGSLMDFTGALSHNAFEQILEQADRAAVQSDVDALRSDWQAVETYLWVAGYEYEKEVNEK